MTQLVVLIVDNPDDCAPILDAWEAIGVPGVTIFDSSGLGRLRKAGFREDLPLLPSLSDFFESDEIRHRTLFSVVDDEIKVEAMISAVHQIIGDLDKESTGFLFTVPVLKAYGLGRKRTRD